MIALEGPKVLRLASITLGTATLLLFFACTSSSSTPSTRTESQPTETTYRSTEGVEPTYTPNNAATETYLQEIAGQAAELAKRVVGALYLLKGKGWDLESKRFVDVQEILSGYYYVADHSSTLGWEFIRGKGLDCSGLIYWSYNKAYNAQTYDAGPVKCEGANGIYYANSVEIAESDLRPGDLLFFDYEGDQKIDYVAMYVGGTDLDRDIVDVTIDSNTILRSKDKMIQDNGGFVGFRRLFWPQGHINCPIINSTE